MRITGLLWFDDSRRPLAEKISRAARGYRAKFGCWPRVCYIHPSAAPASFTVTVEDAHIDVVPRISVLRDHLMLSDSPPDEQEGIFHTGGER